jgi:hypothetical protein
MVQFQFQFGFHFQSEMNWAQSNYFPCSRLLPSQSAEMVPSSASASASAFASSASSSSSSSASFDPSSQHPQEWEVLSMSTMSASTLGHPFPQANVSGQKHDEQSTEGLTKSLLSSASHDEVSARVDSPVEALDLIEDHGELPSEDKPLLNVAVSGEVKQPILALSPSELFLSKK